MRGPTALVRGALDIEIAASSPATVQLLKSRLGLRRADLQPELEANAAQQAKDPAAWDKIADRLASQWDAMQAAYYDSALTSAGKVRMERFVAMLMGEHVH